MSAAIIWSTFADEESAARAAGTLLDEGLVACANIIGGVRSLYTWNGTRGDDRECAVLFKTSPDLLARACARLGAIHPYDTPAISGWRAEATAEPTAAWLAQLTGPGTGDEADPAKPSR